MYTTASALALASTRSSEHDQASASLRLRVNNGARAFGALSPSGRAAVSASPKGGGTLLSVGPNGGVLRRATREAAAVLRSDGSAGSLVLLGASVLSSS